MQKRLLMVWAVAVVLTMSTRAAADMNPSVFEPNVDPFGVSYSEWTARWWQLVISIPTPSNPLNDATGANCAVGQAGPVWFLAGSGGGHVTRTCSVPFGRALLIPVINGECSTAEGNGTTFTELNHCAVRQINAVTFTSASVDGVAIEGLDNFRFDTGLFTFVAPVDNILSFLDGTTIPSGPSNSVANGFFIMVKPPARGQHTIEFHGTAVFGSFVFDESGTITVNVQ